MKERLKIVALTGKINSHFHRRDTGRQSRNPNPETGIHRIGAEHAELRHSRTLLAGIQARPELDPRLKHSGMTPLGVAVL